MLFRTSAIAMLVFPLLVAASVVPRTITPTIPASQCNTGPIQCCGSTKESDALTQDNKDLFDLLGVDINGITGQVGFFCTPLTVIGVGGNSCASQPVCCSNNSFQGIFALGCQPVNLNL